MRARARVPPPPCRKSRPGRSRVCNDGRRHGPCHGLAQRQERSTRERARSAQRGNAPGTLNAGTRQERSTRERARNAQRGTRQERSTRNAPGTRQERARNAQRGTRNAPGTRQERSTRNAPTPGTRQESARNHARKVPGTAPGKRQEPRQELSGKPKDTFRKVPNCLLTRANAIPHSHNALSERI